MSERRRCRTWLVWIIGYLTGGVALSVRPAGMLTLLVAIIGGILAGWVAPEE